MFRLILASLTILAPCVAIAADSPDWTQWRGPARDGTLPAETKAWPDRLNAGNFKYTCFPTLPLSYGRRNVASSIMATAAPTLCAARTEP